MAAIDRHRVQLTVDLSRYDARCIVGELGWTVPFAQYSNWGWADHFAGVAFDNGAYLDVLWSGPAVLKGEK